MFGGWVMKRFIVLLVVSISVFSANAEIVVFSTGTDTTGNYLDNIAVSGLQTNVAEISGLNITSTFGAIGGTVSYLNATSTQLGINSDLAYEGTSYFDTDEWLGVSFDKDVKITRFKFANFTEGDSVQITWGSNILTLADADLNGNNEYVVDWNVGASSVIRFDALGKSSPTSTTGGFGLEEMDITIIPEPATITMIGFGCVTALLYRRLIRRRR